METQVEDLAGKLQEQGYEVEVLTTDSSRGRERLSVQAEVYSGIKVTRVPVWFSLTQFHKFAPGFWRELKRRQFDVLHVHGLRKPELYMALFWAKWRRKKIVVSTHNPFTVVERSRKFKLLLALHDLTLGKLLMRFIDHYFLLSESELAILKELGVKGRQMSVVGNAAHEQFFEPRVANREQFLARLGIAGKYQHIILAVGRINYMKGFQNLRYAIENLPEALFIIVGGDDGYLAELKQELHGLDNLLITGTYYPREQLIDYFTNADIFVMPSMHEPFGITLVEAMAQGCAAVVTNIGGPAGIVGDDYGLSLNPRNQVEWYNKLQLLLADPKLLAKYQQTAKQRAKDFRWQHILPKYLRVYGKA